MSFFDEMFGSAGCNPDGSLGQNPLTALTSFVTDTLPAGPLHNSAPDEAMIMMSQTQQAPQASFIRESVNPSQQQLPFMPAMMPMNTMPMMYNPSFVMVPPHMMQMPLHQHMQTMPPQYVDHTAYIQHDQQYHDHLDQTQFDEAQALADRQQRELIDQENRYLNATSWTVADDHSSALASTIADKEQYNAAVWKDIENKILQSEQGSFAPTNQSAYQFQEQNPYLDNTETGKNNIDKLYEEGLEFFQSGSIQPAILCFEAALQTIQSGENIGSYNVSTSEVWRMLGTCHTENDAEQSAIRCFRLCIESDPYNADALLSLGTCYMNELDSVRALETLRSWVTHNSRFQGLSIVEDSKGGHFKLFLHSVSIFC